MWIVEGMGWEVGARTEGGEDFIEGGRFGTFVLYTRRRQATQRRESRAGRRYRSPRMAPLSP